MVKDTPLPLSQAFDAAAVLGMVLSNRYGLRRYLAYNSLLPPPKSAPSPAVAPIPAAPAPVTGWRRLVTKRALRMYGHFAAVLAAEGFIIYGLPRLASRVVLDYVWGIFQVLFLTVVIAGASIRLFPNNVHISLVRTPRGSISFKEECPTEKWYDDYLRGIAGLAIVTSTLLAARAGVRWPQPLITALFAVQVCAIRMRSVKRVVKVILGAFVILASIILGLILLSLHLGPSDKGDRNESDGSGVTSISEWLSSAVSLGRSALAVVPPSLLLSLTHRFEYRHHAAMPEKVVGPISVPSRVPRFACPLYTAGTFTTLLSLMLATPLLRRFCPELLSNGELGEIGVFFSFPTTLLVLVVGAWREGELREWWNYEENWIPTEAQADDILADQAERRGQEDTKFLDEKMADEARTDAESLPAGRAGDEERVDGSV